MWNIYTLIIGLFLIKNKTSGKYLSLSNIEYLQFKSVKENLVRIVVPSTEGRVLRKKLLRKKIKMRLFVCLFVEVKGQR